MHDTPRACFLSMETDRRLLEELNGEYLRSVQESDVGRFERLLAEDFVNANPDGSLCDRAQFLRRIAGAPGISALRAEDVRIRVLGDLAIIHGRTVYTNSDGLPATGRYTDVWARRGGRWLCVAAHVTRG